MDDSEIFHAHTTYTVVPSECCTVGQCHEFRNVNLILNFITNVIFLTLFSIIFKTEIV